MTSTPVFDMVLFGGTGDLGVGGRGGAPKTDTAGTWEPAASSVLLARDGVSWHEEP